MVLVTIFTLIICVNFTPKLTKLFGCLILLICSKMLTIILTQRVALLFLNVILILDHCILLICLLTTVAPRNHYPARELVGLSDSQRHELLELLDRYSECFSDVPGFNGSVQHDIHVTLDFKPKRLKPHRVPQSLKQEVSKQIRRLLNLDLSSHQRVRRLRL
jgi:hypothetical protein